MQNCDNQLCRSCTRSCKQSAKAIIIECPQYDYNGSQLPPLLAEPGKVRELTGAEKKSLKSLVTSMCANYDKCYNECALLDGACYMLLKHFNNGKLCTYFRDAVLPLDKQLQQSLSKARNENKICGFCGLAFYWDSNKKYCSPSCAFEAKKRADKLRARKYRKNKGSIVTL